MPQEDKIKRELDRVSLMLAKILSKLLHLPGNHGEHHIDVTKEIQDALQIDLEALLSMPPDAALDQLRSGHKFSLTNLRELADILFEARSLPHENANSVAYSQLALKLYEHVQSASGGTLHLDVMYRIRQLQEHI